MAEFEQASRWAVSQGAITLYKAYADSLYISGFNPLTSLQEGEQSLFNEEETLDVDSLLAELDSKIGMMMLEEGMQ